MQHEHHCLLEEAHTVFTFTFPGWKTSYHTREKGWLAWNLPRLNSGEMDIVSVKWSIALYIQNCHSSEQQCKCKRFGRAQVRWVKALRATIILFSLAVNHCGLQTLGNVSQRWRINQCTGLTGASWETIKQDWHLKCGSKWVLYKLLCTNLAVLTVHICNIATAVVDLYHCLLQHHLMTMMTVNHSHSYHKYVSFTYSKNPQVWFKKI